MFGWTVEYCLSMPASQFFSMAGAARKLRSKKMIDLCWVSRSSQLVPEAFEQVLRAFDTSERTAPDPIKIPSVPLQASSEVARYAVMSAFAADTKINRTVKVH